MELVRSEEVAQEAARRLVAAVRSALGARGAAHVALSGGGSVAKVYEAAAAMLDDWHGVELWFGDERLVPLDDEESTYRLAREHLPAPGATWHPVAVDRAPEEAAAAYAREWGDRVLDVALQGMGPDGHTASLFPGREEVRATAPVVAVRDSPKPPPERVTFTLPVLNAARLILLPVSGDGKAEALGRLLAGEPGDEAPVTLLERERLVVVTDLETGPAR
jgi:6-phosphogluconolactonase